MSTFDTMHEPLESRDVLVGRTTHVRRILPNKNRRMIGAWCFLDHYGPDDIKATGGMWVPPHPHTGLQTVTWLFEGEGLHTDSLGSEQVIRPGQLNLMTAGHGICHAEISPDDAPVILHGVQLWTALPDAARDTTAADFTHISEPPTHHEDGLTVKVFMGELAGEVSAAHAFTPLVGAELTLEPGASGTIALDPGFEYGVLTVQGTATVGGSDVPRNSMSYLGAGRTGLSVSAADSADEPAIVMLLGGAPFEEEIVMWWNFIGRTHDDIVEQRESWNGEGIDAVPQRFGQVIGFSGDRLLAPPMPNIRLKARGRSLTA